MLNKKIACCLLLFILSIPLYAQSPEKINLALDNVTLKEFFNTIEKKTGYSFMYNNSEVDESQSISIHCEGKNIQTILDNVFSGKSISYTISGKQIVLKKSAQDGKEKEYKRVITGTVLDKSGESIPGATVRVKGSSLGTSTNIDGHFQLTITNPNSVLEISYLGYTSQEMKIGNSNLLKLTLEEESKALNEVVVIGYGTAKRKDLTGAITTISASDLQNKPSNNVMDFLRGTVAGFNSNMTTTAKGGGSMEIRGPKSITATASPLIVVDGIIYNGDIADINPSDIESMDILKDGSSAAVYGTRAAAGVLAITTRKGTSEKPTITFNATWGASQLAGKQEIYGPEDYITMKGDAKRSMNGFTKPDYYYRNPNNLPSGVTLDTWMDGQTGDPMQIWLKGRLNMSDTEIANYSNGKTMDWMDEVFQSGLKQDYNVGIAGRTKMSNYYFSLGYQNNEGIVVGDTYRNFRARLNLTMNITDWLQVGVNSQFADRDQSTNPARWEDAITASPYGSKYNENGTLKWFPHDDNLAPNPFDDSAADKMDKNTNLVANLFANISLPFNIKYKVIYNNRYSFTKEYNFYSIDTYSGRKIETPAGDLLGGTASRYDGSTYSWQIDNILSWDRTFKNIHRIDLTLLANAEKTQRFTGKVNASQFSPSDILGYHNMAVGQASKLTTENNDTYTTGTALMARINYGLMDRYLLTASIRRDGYSAFGGSNPYANFPSVALAWRITEERFMNWSKDWLDYMKLRLSWGVNGNRSINAYAALAQVADDKAVVDGKSVIRILSRTLANSDLRWEKTTAYNIGVDFTLFRNILSGTVEAYTTSTKDLLLTRALPKITAYASVMANLGELTNKGMEITLNSNNIRRSNFTWASSFTFSFNRNKIKHLYGTTQNILDNNGKVIGTREADDTSNRWYIGHALDQIYGYKVLGVWQESEREEANKYGLKPGDRKLLDVRNFEGRTEGVRSDEDRVFQGYTQPRYRLGLRNDFTLFKCVDISFFLRSDLGHYDSNSNHKFLQLPNYYDRLNAYKYDYWTPENPRNDTPRLLGNINPNYNYYKLKSFVRLQDLSISYTLPAKLLSKVQIQNAKIFFNGNNLITVSGWDYWDPETGAPTPRVYTLGINFTL